MDGLLCSAKLGVRLPFAPGASTAWEGGTRAFFVVAGGVGATLLNSASAALSLRQDGRGDGSSGAVARQTPSPARRESSMRTLRAVGPSGL